MNRLRVLLITLFVIGFLLRLYPLMWGSAFYDPGQFSLHSDEPNVVRYVDDFPDTLITNHDYRYPTFIHNVWGAAWVVAGETFNLRDDEISAAGTPSYERALIFGRALNILIFGLGSMILTWAFARKLFGFRVALWTVGCLNLFVWTVASTALVQVDVCSAFGLLLVFYLLIDVERSPGLIWSRSIWVGLALGTAVSMKYTSAIGALPVALVCAKSWYRGRANPLEVTGFLTVTALSGLLAFTFFVPGAIFDFDNFIQSVLYEFKDKSSGVASHVSFEGFLASLGDSLPFWLLVPAFFGVIYAIRHQFSVVMLSVLISMSLYILITRRSFKPDYGILLVPYVASFAGLAISRFSVMHSIRTTGALAAALLILGHVHTAWALHSRYSLDTRYAFQEWALENIPPGPIGEAPRASKYPYWSSPKVPPGYEFVSVHLMPDWIVLNKRDSSTAMKAITDGVERFHHLGPLDLAFYEDVLLDKRRKYDYELVFQLEPEDLPLDKQGKAIQVYRKRTTE
jgi:hypothetical protein